MPARLHSSASLRCHAQARHGGIGRGMRRLRACLCLRHRSGQVVRQLRCDGRRSRGRGLRRIGIGVGVAVLACLLVGRHVSEGEVGVAGVEAAEHAQPRHRAARHEIRHRQRAATAVACHVSIAGGSACRASKGAPGQGMQRLSDSATRAAGVGRRALQPCGDAALAEAVAAALQRHRLRSRGARARHNAAQRASGPRCEQALPSRAPDAARPSTRGSAAPARAPRR